jgi:hypothetical protein
MYEVGWFSHIVTFRISFPSDQVLEHLVLPKIAMAAD